MSNRDSGHAAQKEAGSKPASPTGEPAVTYKLPRYLPIWAIVFWVVVSIAGAVSLALPTLPQEAAITIDGQPVGMCSEIAPDLVAEDQSIDNDWCTTREHVGPILPDNVEYVATGTILWDAVDFDDVLKPETVLEVWFTISLGAIALCSCWPSLRQLEHSAPALPPRYMLCFLASYSFLRTSPPSSQAICATNS